MHRDIDVEQLEFALDVLLIYGNQAEETVLGLVYSEELLDIEFRKRELVLVGEQVDLGDEVVIICEEFIIVFLVEKDFHF